MINKLTARVALVGVLCVGGSQVFALTVEEAITATTDAGYSAVAVRTSRDGTVTSVLATDGTSYYEIDYDTDSGEATSTTEVTTRDTSFETLVDRGHLGRDCRRRRGRADRGRGAGHG